MHSQLLSKPQPNLNTVVGFDLKMTLHTTPHHPQKHYVSYISAVTDPISMKLWADSNWQDDICPGNIWAYQEHVSCYWPNFDQTLNIGFWEHIEQIPGNIRLGKIFPYQDYLSCHWPNFQGMF